MSRSWLSRVTKSQQFKAIRRTLSVFAVAVLALLGLVLLAALSLPPLMSSDYGLGLATRALESALGKPVAVERLEFSWTGGLRLTSLRIGQGDLPSPTFLARVAEARLDLGYRALLSGDLRMDLAVRGLRLRLPHTPKEPDPPLPESLRKAFALLRTGVAPVDADVDAHMRLELTDAIVRIEPEPGGQPLELCVVNALVESSGLRHAPLHVAASLSLRPITDNAQPIPVPISLEAKLTDLKDANGRLVPAQAKLDARLDAPGTELLVQGSMDAGITASLRADARTVRNAFAPLVPAPLPELSGSLAASASIKRQGAEGAQLGLALFVDALRAAKGPLGSTSVGPLSLNLLQEAELDLVSETAAMPGSMELRPQNGEASRLGWTAQLDGLQKNSVRLGVGMSDVRLQLAPLLPALQGFLPAGLSLKRAEFGLDRLDLASEISSEGGRPDIRLVLRGFSLRVERATLLPARLQARNVGLLVHEAAANLPASEPWDIRAKAAVEADSLLLDGEKTLTLKAFRLPNASLEFTNLLPTAEALYGVSGQLALKADVRLHGLEATDTASVPNMDIALAATGQLPTSKTATVAVRSLSVSAPKLRIQHPSGHISTPLELLAVAPKITLGHDGLTGFTDASVRLDLGRAGHGDATASLAARSLRSTGGLRIDAGRALALCAPLVPSGLAASGTAEATWTLDAELPAATNAGGPSITNSLKEKLKKLEALHELHATLRLDRLDISLPLAAPSGGQPEPLRLRGLTTPRPMRLAVRQGLRRANLEGSVAFGPLETVPGAGRLARPISGLLTINAAQQSLRSAQLSQMLHLDGLELDQNLTFTVDKLDSLLGAPDILAAALERLDGAFAFRLATSLAALPPRAKAKGLGGTGQLEAQAQGRLTGGRTLDVSARLLSPGLDLSLGPDMAVQGMTSTLRLGRRFRLAPGLACPGDAPSAAAPLSEQVFDLFPAQGEFQSSAEAPLGGVLLQDNAGDAGAVGGALTAARIRLRAGRLAVDLRDLAARLDDTGPVPGLKSFRCGLLGGDILGSAMLRKTAGRYTLDADLGFTGIDAANLVQGGTARDAGDQAEASGRVTVSLPLTPDPEELLRRLVLRVDITKIGPRTLERVLYALDPDEQNEAIVQQRRLMDMGHPRHLRVAASYGNLSVTGAVEIKGFRLDLPPVDRLPIANLPLRDKLAMPLAAVPGFIRLLDAASGTHICHDPADPQGALRVVEPAKRGGSR